MSKSDQLRRRFLVELALEENGIPRELRRFQNGQEGVDTLGAGAHGGGVTLINVDRLSRPRVLVSMKLRRVVRDAAF